ncbi:Rne/Rng family ribonuclease [Georgenia faecalis]|uniref:Rne/Rng family ribonuclease n=1 Tax=Georgenia faecalis TaxID=2483799 RepID=UPI003A90EC8F
MPADATPAESAARTEPAAPTRRRRSKAAATTERSATQDAPARSPEQTLDVLKELGLPAAQAPAAQAPAAPAEQEKPARSRRGRGRATTPAAAEQNAPQAAPAAETPEPSGDDGPRLAATALLFQAPDLTKARGRRRPARAEVPAEVPAEEETVEELAEDEALTEATAEEETTEVAAEPETDTEDADEDSDEEATGQRRRRRRGGRGRRNRTGQREGGTDEGSDDAEDSAEAETPAVDETSREEPRADQTDEGDDESEGGTRRRRRRRSGGRGGEGESSPAREGRTARDEVTALKGSTRLEAKRQRRRDGRDAGRRRTTITESEFLARREAVDRSMVVREKSGRTQIAVLEDGVLVEHYVAQKTQSSMVGNVYLGRVQNVLPSMEAAFVDIGKGRNAVLYAGEVNWDAAGMEGQPRRIEHVLSSGDAVLVQVTKDPIGHKGARLTAQITLAGRYLVLVPSGAMTGISRKLPENERARLKKLLKEIVPAGSGVIVRTAAEGATEEQLRADVERLTAQWADIEAKQKTAKTAPVLLRGEPELAVRVVRDVFNEDFTSLTVSGDEAWETISTYVRSLAPDLAERMHHWTSSKDVFAAHRVDEQLAKGMDRKVWLPSGGSLVIDRTEAMTVVDVNTGKFTGTGGTLEETVTRNNLEAAEEIVRQLRLRDIGGIIVIDFIDMVLESNRELVLRRLIECLGRDRTRHQVAEVTSLGLVQMTRKRVGQGLVEAFSETCEHCNGRGFIVHADPVERAPEEDNGGGRRRGGKRDEEAAVVVPAAVAAPAEPALSQDPAAVAAREAVRATLATIAAAAAQAHGEREDEGATADTGDATAPAQEPTATAPADPSEPAATEPVAAATTEAATTEADVAPVETGSAETAPVAAPVEAIAEVPATGGRKRRPRRASSSGRAPATEASGGMITAPAEAPVVAPAASASTSAPAPVASTDAPAPLASAPAAAPVVAVDVARADVSPVEPRTSVSGDGEAAQAPAAPAEEPRRRGGRRPRRATSGGPVTA